jgi:steroid 5-alpha reductase family enzyme
MWWSFYLLGVSATGRWLDASIARAALLTLLIQGSTALAEQITLGKYPAYAD